MPRGARPLAVALAGLVALSGCADGTGSGASRDAPFEPVYRGVSTQLLDDDLVRFHVEMTGARDNEDVVDYARCAAAGYTLIRGFGFARHVRTTVYKEGSVWLGDAVYTVSPALPDGLRTLDAEVVAEACAANGIPRV